MDDFAIMVTLNSAKSNYKKLEGIALELMSRALVLILAKQSLYTSIISVLLFFLFYFFYPLYYTTYNTAHAASRLWRYSPIYINPSKAA